MSIMPSPLLPDHPTAKMWLDKLHFDLLQRRYQGNRLASYYSGEQPIEFASDNFRKAFYWLLQKFADNWCGIVVDCKEERLKVEGFRVGGAVDATGKRVGDTEAWRIWQANDLDAQAQMVHTEALIHGESLVTVWVSDDDQTPRITAEHPLRAITHPNPLKPYESLAGLRVYEDWQGYERAELFLPDGVYMFKSRRPAHEYADGMRYLWDMDVQVYADGFQPNPFGVVPMVVMPNNPRLARMSIHQRSELWRVLPLQDMLNKLMVDMIVSSEFQSFRQRWATGLELDRDVDGKAIEPFKVGVDRMFISENPEVKFGEFGSVDLSQYVNAIEAILRHIAGIASVPPHYLGSTGDRISGESIKSAEGALVASVRKKMVHFGDAWERVMRMAGIIAGIPELENATSMETIWGDPEIRTDATRTDSAVKMQAVGIPWGAIMEFLDFSPPQIERMRAERMTDSLLASLTTPTPPALNAGP
jgi:Phage portal protein, SPP1 Gp6-like